MTSRQPAAKNTTIMRTRIGPALSLFGANSSLKNPFRPISCKAQTIQQAKKTSAMASVMFTSALAPRKSGTSSWKPAAVTWPQPIEPTPGIRPNQFAARMKMKTDPKNQKVRSTRWWPMTPSRKR